MLWPHDTRSTATTITQHTKGSPHGNAATLNDLSALLLNAWSPRFLDDSPPSQKGNAKLIAPRHFCDYVCVCVLMFMLLRAMCPTLPPYPFAGTLTMGAISSRSMVCLVPQGSVIFVCHIFMEQAHGVKYTAK